jgi:hypothetical protein
MEAYETYSTVLIVLTVALLLIPAGIGKKQLVWERPRRSRSAAAGARSKPPAPYRDVRAAVLTPSALRAATGADRRGDYAIGDEELQIWLQLGAVPLPSATSAT